MNELIIQNPHGNLEAAQRMCAYILQRGSELEKSADAITVTAENYNDPQTKAAIEDLGEAVEDLRESGKKLIGQVLDETEAKRVITQIDPRLYTYSTKSDPNAVYTRLSKKHKELKDAVKKFKDAAKPKERSFKRVMIFDATESQFAKIVDAMIKAGIPACGDAAILTKPEHIERVNKVIKAVQAEEDAAAAAMIR